MNHIEKSKELGLDPDDYVLIGGSVLDIHGIRSSTDVDVVVSQEAFQTLKDRGWKIDEEFTKKWGNERLVNDVFEVVAHFNWEAYNNYNLSFKALHDMAQVIDGVNVEPLGVLLLGKLDIGREKDLKDVELIEKHFAARLES